ncbi:MAG: exosortase system-associated protein, TIGR04073 family [Verrucomicrobia bacterium]|nr:exosortase system-associated protein, TIGR04073 family [Verrucomicrobiota bacterium]
MRKSLSLLTLAAAASLFAAGCAGPQVNGPMRKLGRGFNNVTEITRAGEIRRSMEQTALWESPDKAYTFGFLRGLHRTMQRTVVGAFEIVTFPVPGYEPYLLPEHPVYPDSYKPGILADQTFAHDASLGFSGGDIAPMFPGSRFHIFDY